MCASCNGGFTSNGITCNDARKDKCVVVQFARCSPQPPNQCIPCVQCTNEDCVLPSANGAWRNGKYPGFDTDALKDEWHGAWRNGNYPGYKRANPVVIPFDDKQSDEAAAFETDNKVREALQWGIAAALIGVAAKDVTILSVTMGTGRRLAIERSLATAEEVTVKYNNKGMGK